MRVTIDDRGNALRHRLSERLERARLLRCPEHGVPVVAVDISVRENGWFDTRWTTCCDALERQAVAIVKDRF
jgi:hypothetical protein